MCLRTRPDLAATVYYRHNSLKARAQLTQDLIRANAPSPEDSSSKDALSRWKTVEKKLDDLIPFRNRIAHHPVEKTPISDIFEEFDAFIDIPFGEQLRTGKFGTNPLRVEDVKQHLSEVIKLREKLEELYTQLLPKLIG
jgi:hypothetical protein